MKRWVRLSTGWGLISLGLIGLLLPLLPGFIFLVLGSTMLVSESSGLILKSLETLCDYYPRGSVWLDETINIVIKRYHWAANWFE